MSKIITFIKVHSVLTYFVLTFAISWGSALLVIGGLSGIPATREEFEKLLPIAIPGLLAGPSIAGMLLIAIVYGRAGFRDLRSRLLRWRVGARWYALALLAAPVLFLVVQLALSLNSPIYLPGIFTTNNKASLLISSLVGAIIVSVFEELGWMGFAAPRLRLQYGVFATGLIVGVLWGAWHLLMNIFWAGEVSSGELSIPLYVTVGSFLTVIGQLPAYRVLMVWVYDRTGSLLLAILMHVGYAASTFIIGPGALVISGVNLLIYGLALTAAWWLVVAAVAVVSGGQLEMGKGRYTHVTIAN